MIIFRIEVVVEDSIFAQFKLIWNEIYRYFFVVIYIKICLKKLFSFNSLFLWKL